MASPAGALIAEAPPANALIIVAPPAGALTAEASRINSPRTSRTVRDILGTDHGHDRDRGRSRRRTRQGHRGPRHRSLRPPRHIFEMSRFENKSVKEIAEITQLSTKSIEYHITKSLKTLRTALKDYLPLFYFLFF